MNWHICHKRKLLFCSYFRHISLFLYSNFDQESSLDAEFDSTSNEYPHCILLMDPTTPKTRNTWKNVMMMSSSHFSGISCIWGSGVHQKYVVWVLVGCGIKFCIQWSLPLIIWVKTQGDMSKIWTKKSSFLLWQICQFNHYGWLILLKFYWFLNSNSQNLLLALFLIRPILDPKFPIMVHN